MKIDLHDLYGECVTLDIPKEQVELLIGTLNQHVVSPTTKVDANTIDEKPVWVDNIKMTLADCIQQRANKA